MGNYLIRGKVIQGKSRGKNLGFPTANIRLHKNIPEGIYISQVKIKGRFYPALTFIGSPKTFQETDKKIESHLLEFSANLYNQWISVRLVKKIRENIEFKSAEDLVTQMKKDEQDAKDYFKNV